MEKPLDYVKEREKQIIPGYGGHCPMVNSFYGTTYGNATKTSYVVSEQESSKTSAVSSLRRRTSSDPAGLTIDYQQRPGSSLRPSSALRYSQWTHPPYNLSHTGKRRDEILTFNETSQLHRNHYQDLTGTIQQMPSFKHRRVASAPATRTLPSLKPVKVHFQTSPNNVDSYMKFSKFPFRDLKHPKYINRQPSAREKERRDMHFERR